MAIAASSEGGVLVRVDPGEGDRLVGTTKAEPMVMRGRPMSGWLRVDADHVRTKRQLETWVRRGAAYAASLPPKKK
jgi:TfoX/Sxy family transcriptional regulator of competence genes